MAVENLADRAAQAANKLRTVQISFADESPDRRQEYVAEELDHLLEGIVADDRAEFLKALESQFPCWDIDAPAGMAQGVPEKAETPEDLADQFLEQVQLLDDDERDAVLRRLQAGGLAVQGASEQRPSAGDGALPRHIEKAAQYLMHKAGTDKLDLTRSIKLLVRLMDLAGSADPLMWSTWRLVAPRSAVRRECDLRKEMVRYLSGDRDISGMEMNSHVDKMKKLIACLIAGMGQAPGEFTRGFLTKFLPQEIEAKVGTGGSGLLVSKEYKCWEKYQEMAHELSEQNVEHAVKEAIRTRTEALFRKTTE